MHVVDIEWRIDLRNTNRVPVVLTDSIADWVKPFSDFHRVMHTDVPRKMRIQSVRNLARFERSIGAKPRGLRTRVHACIGSSRAKDRGRLTIHSGRSFFNCPLNGTLIGLSLPTRVLRTDIRNLDRERLAVGVIRYSHSRR